MKKTDKIHDHLDDIESSLEDAMYNVNRVRTLVEGDETVENNPDNSDLSLLDVRIDELMEHCKYLVKSQIKNHLELICYLEDFINK